MNSSGKTLWLAKIAQQRLTSILNLPSPEETLAHTALGLLLQRFVPRLLRMTGLVTRHLSK